MKPTPIICCAIPTIKPEGLSALHSGSLNFEHTSLFRMRAFTLVDGHTHGEEADSPPCHDTTDEHHGKVHGCTLENCADASNASTDDNGPLSAKSVHGKTTHQTAKNGPAREGGIDCADNWGCFGCIEEIQKMGRLNHVGHDCGPVSSPPTHYFLRNTGLTTRVVAKQERSKQTAHCISPLSRTMLGCSKLTLWPRTRPGRC